MKYLLLTLALLLVAMCLLVSSQDRYNIGYEAGYQSGLNQGKLDTETLYGFPPPAYHE